MAGKDNNDTGISHMTDDMHRRAKRLAIRLLPWILGAGIMAGMVWR